ncbi:MAG: lecithin retinol acyltransferase family protein, partial [Clostridia bacterium]|nr:lecithin retinol acyltransferase family protein [Clostridia bacterium]
ITIVGTLFDNIQLIFMAYPITWTISSVIFLIYLCKADWMHKFERQEKKKRFSPEKTVSRAKSRLGETGYNILENNCEHFVYDCAFGKEHPFFQKSK